MSSKAEWAPLTAEERKAVNEYHKIRKLPCTVKEDPVAEAKRFGFDLDPETGELNGHCNVCDTYAVLPGANCYCQSCIDNANQSTN